VFLGSIHPYARRVNHSAQRQPTNKPTNQPASHSEPAGTRVSSYLARGVPGASTIKRVRHVPTAEHTPPPRHRLWRPGCSVPRSCVPCGCPLPLTQVLSNAAGGGVHRCPDGQRGAAMTSTSFWHGSLPARSLRARSNAAAIVPRRAATCVDHLALWA